MPLWTVEVFYVQSAFNRRQTVTARVLVESMDEPTPAPMTEIRFSGLRVEVRVKAGSLIESWTADAVDTSFAGKPVPSASAPAAAAAAAVKPGEPGKAA